MPHTVLDSWDTSVNEVENSILEKYQYNRDWCLRDIMDVYLKGAACMCLGEDDQDN